MMHETKNIEKALLVMVEIGQEIWPTDILIEEFKNLVISAGIEIVDLIVCRRKIPDMALFVGTGKVLELAEAITAADCHTVIFNNDLKASQQRNLEDALKIKVIDRTQLILDIFAKRAHSQEGILQVELAQLRYLLPRLKGKGIEMSRLGGGIGTRGPGETKLEIDRRKITDRITYLEKDLEIACKRREVMRKKRDKNKQPVCALVGYTNAGKSTLFNILSGAREKADSRLFTTLDTVSRIFTINNNQKVLISDTVGFIHNLPEHLTAAFKATMEELYHSDILLHVVDISVSNSARLRFAVDQILTKLQLQEKPQILVFNKLDAVDSTVIETLRVDWPNAVFISALRGIGFDELKSAVYQAIFKNTIEAVIEISYEKMALTKEIHTNCEVIKETAQVKGMMYHVRAKQHVLDFLNANGVKIEISQNISKKS